MQFHRPDVKTTKSQSAGEGAPRLPFKIRQILKCPDLLFNSKARAKRGLPRAFPLRGWPRYARNQDVSIGSFSAQNAF